MLGLLLLQVLASCLCLGHGEVVKSFTTACTQFFYKKTPPSDTLRPTNAARICQRLSNKYHFATLYDKTRRIPVYSAYIYRPGRGDRSETWFIEPQLIDQGYHKAMDTEDSIERQYQISSDDIGRNQAIDHDYRNLKDLDRGHLCPSSHQPDDDSKSATFTLTNIVPQNKSLNQEAWKIYEKSMARKAENCDTTYVITGAVPGNNKVPTGRVNIPSYIWSAACCLVGDNPTRAWGAIAENNKNEVKELSLERLENKLSEIYGGKDVTLFNKACPRRKP
ncbi:endonuclease domain-containing 1 protein-like [Oenanthe melanoleuca]|uniref:endonuclease domain-containing 1 protein-like n=1 Tax=Oenanthe melanoleuca TaxID=2939378 RepID=UPI0024C1F005|nr:endonuclease domain-containing 1 protein-like [Oenanthe melanoleuca]